MHTRTPSPRLRMTLPLILLTLGLALPAHADVILTADQSVYTVGDIVHLSATNAGPEVEQFLSAPFFLIYNNDTGDCVFGCLGLPVITPFAVGETVTMDHDTGFLPDPVGHYTVSLALGGSPTVDYLLEAAVSIEPESWGAVKALYR